MSFYIKGTGAALPQKIVSNYDLAEFLDTSDEWIVSRTGIKTRHLMGEEHIIDLAARAALNAIEDAKIRPDEIDMVIFASLQGEYLTPSSSCLLTEALCIKCKYVFDVNMACSGFIYALDLADTYIKAEKAEKVLIVCAEEMSRFVDWNDRATCVLFGDGAGAVLLEKGKGLDALTLSHKGNEKDLSISANKSNSPFLIRNELENPYLQMDGQEIFLFAVTSSLRDIRGILKQTGYTSQDISFYFLHQANLRILQTVQKKLKLEDERFPHNIEHCGNTSSASIPILLDEWNKQGKIKKGDRILLSAFGAGLTSAAAILTWN